MKSVMFLLLGAALAVPSFAGPPHLSTIERLKKEGKAYFQQIVENKQYDRLLQRIEKGDRMLIQNAPVIKPYTDASTALALRFALSRALIRAPEDVMSLVPEHFSVSEICTVPYLEDQKAEKRHVEYAIVTLKYVQNPTPAHRECLKTYRQIKDWD